MNTIPFQSIPEHTTPKMTASMKIWLVDRVEPYALYVTDALSFEVHMISIKHNNYNQFTDTMCTTYEKIAGNEDFGSYGWCFDRLSTVFRNFGLFGDRCDVIMQKLSDLDIDYLF